MINPREMKTACIVIFCHLFMHLECCSEVYLKSNQGGAVIVGRALEYNLPLNSNIVLEPAGTRKGSFKPLLCSNTKFEWISKYDVVCLDGMNQPVCVDGMNSAGLSASSLQFPGHAEYEKVSQKDCTNCIANLQIVDYITGNFASTTEVRASIQNGSFPKVFNQLLFNMRLEIHISIVDATGDGLVLEYTKDGRKIHENKAQVVTGSPPYDFHMLNLKHVYSTEQNESMLRSVPSDHTSISQFVRARSLVRDYENTKSLLNDLERVNHMFHLLNSLDITKGSMYPTMGPLPQRKAPIYTQWSVVKDLKNRIVYLHSYADLSIRKVQLKDIRPNAVVKIPVERKFQNGVKDMFDHFYTKTVKG